MCDGVSVVVPVFIGSQTLEALVQRTEEALEGCAPDFEIILVNDGSPDESWAVITRLATGNPRVRGINLMRNSGQHSATLAGIRDARFPLTVTIDDDLQNPPEEIPMLLAALDDEHDVVYGSPRQERHGLLRDIASRATKGALATATGVKAARNASAFRAFRTHLRIAFETYSGSHPSIDVLLSWGTKRFTSVTVEHSHREAGRSNYSFLKLMTHAINMATGFSTVPLRIATILGFIFTLFGFGILVYVVARFLVSGTSVPGFPFLASIIAIFSGVQLFALGIFGEYLARMHFRLMDRPPYIIHERIGSQSTSDGDGGHG